ncbi:MAG: carbamoyltransferase family protein [Chloroflexota bacterium]
MVVLGLVDSKPSTAAILVDGKIVAAISEERLSRMKMAGGTPREAISWVMGLAGVTPRDIDLVAVAGHMLAFAPEPVPWSGWFESRGKPRKRLLDDLGSRLAPLVGRTPVAWQAHHLLKRALTRDRLTKLPALLRKVYGIAAPVRYFDHHHCHAASAYYTSNFDRALVVTLDGGGDGRSGSVYTGENGRLRQLASVDSFNSLGNFYSYITIICGFKAERHEGKITGLAALGEPIYADILRQMIRYEEPGQIRYTVPMYHRSAVREIARRLPKDFDRAALAASAQLVLEEVGVAFVKYWLRRTGMKNVAVAGGVFSNVKFNQRIHEIPGVEGFSVHPAMDDSGLSVGSAFAALAQQRGVDPARLVHRLSNVYFGMKYSDDEVAEAVRASGCTASHEENIHEAVARLLAQGFVVARHTGRMEYGPRALGHRTVFYQTTDPSVNNWLNERLIRTEFMPFAPATLVEYADSCYNGLRGAEDAARFMTITFDCTPSMRATSPGVVHVDGTARPQLVDPETAPDSYEILQAYHRLTGIPSLINTSFNMHEEPIVASPEDALRSFQQGNLDYLAIGNWLVSNAEAIAGRERTKSAEPHRMS